MVKLIITIVTFLIGLVSIAQVSESRVVANFSKIKVSQGVEVVYTIATNKSVKVETDNSEKLNLIKTKVVNGTLKIYVDTKGYKENSYKKTKKLKSVNTVNGVAFQVLKVIVSGPNLESIHADSAAKIVIVGVNQADNLDLELSSSGTISGKFSCVNAVINASSSGDLSGELNAKNANIDVSSSSDISLEGVVDKLSITASSASDCNLKNLVVNNAYVNASSAANVLVQVLKSIEAKATSSADITYYGNPKQVNNKESSLGTIIKK